MNQIAWQSIGSIMSIENPQRLYVWKFFFNMNTKLNANWIVGFVDGEGCFHIAINQNSKLKQKVQVLPEFTVVQHKQNIQILYALKAYFGCGVVRTNHGDRMAYRVRGHKNLREIIIPFFEKYKLKTTKMINFQKFRKVVILMERDCHLTLSGLKEIREIKKQMNILNQDSTCSNDF